MKAEFHPTEYHAKFERERKERPSEWVIVPTQGRGYELQNLGKQKDLTDENKR